MSLNPKEQVRLACTLESALEKKQRYAKKFAEHPDEPGMGGHLAFVQAEINTMNIIMGVLKGKNWNALERFAN